MLCLVGATLLIGGMVHIWSKRTLHGELALHTRNDKGHICLGDTDNFLWSASYRLVGKLSSKHTLFGRNENRKKCIVHVRVPYGVDFFKSLD